MGKTDTVPGATGLVGAQRYTRMTVIGHAVGAADRAERVKADWRAALAVTPPNRLQPVTLAPQGQHAKGVEQGPGAAETVHLAGLRVLEADGLMVRHDPYCVPLVLHDHSIARP